MGEFNDHDARRQRVSYEAQGGKNMLPSKLFYSLPLKIAAIVYPLCQSAFRDCCFVIKSEEVQLGLKTVVIPCSTMLYPELVAFLAMENDDEAIDFGGPKISDIEMTVGPEWFLGSAPKCGSAPNLHPVGLRIKTAGKIQEFSERI